MPEVADRLAGARAVTHEAGAPLEVVEAPGLTVAAGRAAGAAIARRSSRVRPTAVFCANDLLALGLLQAVSREGLRVPDDVAIVGYDDIDYAAAAAVPLTSVRKPRHELGRRAAELLLDEAAGGHGGAPHAHQQLVFSPELVVRESSTVRHRRAATTREAP